MFFLCITLVFSFICRRSPSGISGDSLGFQRQGSDTSSESGEERDNTAMVVCSKTAVSVISIGDHSHFTY